MKIKTSGATNKQIDWLVATIQNIGCLPPSWHNWLIVPVDGSADFYSPSTDWAQGGPIIDQMMCEGLQLVRPIDVPSEQYACRASLGQSNSFYFGPTPLIAAMRCFCASKLGDEVEVPEELV